MASSKIVLRDYNGFKVAQRASDGYWDLTSMAAATARRVDNWLRLDNTKKLLELFAKKQGLILPVQTASASSDLREHPQGISLGKNQHERTFAHRHIAIQFAQWCSPEFALWVSEMIDELLTTGQAKLEKKAIANFQRRQKTKHKLSTRYTAQQNVEGLMLLLEENGVPTSLLTPALERAKTPDAYCTTTEMAEVDTVHSFSYSSGLVVFHKSQFAFLQASDAWATFKKYRQKLINKGVNCNNAPRTAKQLHSRITQQTGIQPTFDQDTRNWRSNREMGHKGLMVFLKKGNEDF